MLTRITLLLVLALSFTSCSKQAPPGPNTAEKPIVLVGIPPQYTFVKKIAGDLLQIETVLPPGADPHTFSIGPRSMETISQAALYFPAGMEFEPLDLQQMKNVVDISANLKKRTLAQTVQEAFEDHHEEKEDHDHDHHHGDHDHKEHNHSDHDHEHDHEHHHHDHSPHSIDPHYWMSPRNVIDILPVIEAALTKIAPAHAATFRANAEAYRKELEQLHGEIQTTLAPYRGSAVFVYHPAFGYFLDEYGLKQISIETEGKEPSPKQIQALIELARRESATIIALQPQYSPRPAQIVADAIAAKLITVDDLSENYTESLRTFAKEIAASKEKKE